MGLHVAQMTSQDGMWRCFDAVTTSAAKVMHVERYGLEARCHASFVLLQAHEPIEAIRLRATRLKVFRKGKPIAATPRATAALLLDGRPHITNFML